MDATEYAPDRPARMVALVLRHLGDVITRAGDGLVYCARSNGGF